MTDTIRSALLLPGHILEIAQGDLTEEKVDAIVNAANSTLVHGGGVAGAILRKGGAEIQSESNTWVKQHGPVSHSSPAYTGAGKLPCRCVIHAVGPVWGEGDEDRKLADAIHGSLALADKLGFKSLAIPPISTGIFAFPRERAAPIFYSVISEYFKQNPTSGLTLVRLVILDKQPTLEIFIRGFDSWKSTTENNPIP